MNTQLRLMKRFNAKDQYYESVGPSTPLTADDATFLPKDGEKIQLLEYIKGLSLGEYF